MPRTREDNDRIRQQTKQNIRDTAMTLFMERGYHATSIDEVARRAGVSKGLMYNYFAGKEALLAEMVKERINQLEQVMGEAASQPTASAQLTAVLEGALDSVQQEPHVYRFYLHIQTQPTEDDVLSIYSKQLNDAMAEQFTVQCAMFAKLGAADPEIRSLCFSSMLQGAMLMLATYPNQYPVDVMKQQIKQQFGLQ